MFVFYTIQFCLDWKTNDCLLHRLNIEMCLNVLFSDIREPDTELFLPWFQKGRPIVSGGIFSNFLGTTAMSSMLILNGKHHTIQCDYRELENPSVVAYTHLRS